MTYKILIKNENGMLVFATEKKEIMEKQIAEDGETIIEVGTGKFEFVPFETEDVQKLKDKYVELMDTYKKTQLNAIADVTETVTINVEIEEIEPKTE